MNGNHFPTHQTGFFRLNGAAITAHSDIYQFPLGLMAVATLLRGTISVHTGELVSRARLFGRRLGFMIKL